MSSPENNSEKEKDKMFEYIDKHIKLCTLEEKTTILTKIIAQVGKSCVHVTSDSSNIYLDDMPIALLQEIRDFIESVNNRNRIDFSDIGIYDIEVIKKNITQ